jgi:hypothetical protein
MNRSDIGVLSKSAQSWYRNIDARYAISNPKEFAGRVDQKFTDGKLRAAAVLLQMQRDCLASLCARCI